MGYYHSPGQDEFNSKLNRHENERRESHLNIVNISRIFVVTTLLFETFCCSVPYITRLLAMSSIDKATNLRCETVSENLFSALFKMPCNLLLFVVVVFHLCEYEDKKHGSIQLTVNVHNMGLISYDVHSVHSVKLLSPKTEDFCHFTLEA